MVNAAVAFGDITAAAQNGGNMNELNLMSIAEMREHEWDVPWSGGKDSTATILLMLELGIPIRQVNHVRMMFDAETPATLPPIVKFVDIAAQKLRGLALTVNIVPSKKTAYEIANMIYTRSKYTERNGKIYGVRPFIRGCCKFSAQKSESADKSNIYQMIGYASDELGRLHRLSKTRQSVLASAGIAEKVCFEICQEAGFLAPTYDDGILRDGCWFCPNCSKRERKRIRDEYPNLFDKIVQLIEMTDTDCSSIVCKNNWLNDYAKEHPDDWRWKDSRYAHPKGWIPGQIVMEET